MSVDPSQVAKVAASFERLHQYVVKHRFAGWEYDDLLASPFVRFMTGWGLYPRIAAVQTAKRFPINLRPLLGVPKLQSTKAWGFMIKGYLLQNQLTANEAYLQYAKQGLDWLLEHTCNGYHGISWGNDFDYASRSGFYPKGLPTIVWTAHIQAAFAMAYQVFQEERYKEVVCQVADFVEHDLERMADETGFGFAYSPGILTPVHNSNLLGAVALLRAWEHTQNQQHFELARQSLNWSLSKINEDGSWYYGHQPMLHWIDNYHTGYNLDCLSLAQRIGGEGIVPESIITRTYQYWVDHFFLPDGCPKFYHNKLHPIDIQATAQAIESLSKYSVREPKALQLAWRVANWAIDHMQKLNGSFQYRIYKHWTNKLEAIHWGQATMHSALSHLLYYSNSKKEDIFAS